MAATTNQQTPYDAQAFEKANAVEHAAYSNDQSLDGKGHDSFVEEVANVRQDGYNDLDEGFDPSEVKKTIRKVDGRLIPILIAMYFISQCDRSNLGQARAANQQAMQKDLKLNEGNNRYGLIVLMFFIPYIILEIPSQLGLRKFGARWWLGGACVLWGIVILGMGFVENWLQMVGLRVLLGAFESCLFPGAAFLLACWYPRAQISLRISMFYTISQSFAGMSAILSYGISQMHTIAGYSGWRWIFIIYGIMTIVIGVAGILFIVDFPDKAHFLSEHQRYIIKTRIQRDRNDAEPDSMTMKKMLKYSIDLKLWVFGFLFGSSGLGIYALSYFMPRILQSIGFTNALTQLLMAPPYIYMLIPCLITAKVSDTVPRMRMVMVVFNCICAIVGTVLFSHLPTGQKGARYFGVFLACGGVNANLSLSIGWAQSSIRAQSKRGFSSALVVAWGGIGGILSSVAFIESEAPNYPTGIYLIISMEVASVVFAALLALWFIRQNRRADKGEVVLEDDPNFRYQW